VATVISGDFEWDDIKAERNLRIHGVSFDEAITAFEDEHHHVFDDGSGLDRFVLIGFSAAGRLLTVVHVERGERDRIISAWTATRVEEDLYERYRP
jgi:uncharacterized DUF497 family protein